MENMTRNYGGIPLGGAQNNAQSGELWAMIEDVQREAEQLHELAILLHKRTEGVCRSEPPSPGEVPKDSRLVTTAAGSRLNDIMRLLRKTGDALHSISTRLEV